MGTETENLWTVKLTAVPLLTDEDRENLAGLCEAKAFEHAVCPSGDPERRQAWLDLAAKLRS